MASAFSLGLPVIGIRGDMNNEILKHNENIYLSIGLDASHLAKDIKFVLESKVLLNVLREGAVGTFNNYLSWTEIAKKILDSF